MSAPAPMHVYQIHIRASAAQVWRALTDPEFTKRYFHGTAFESTLEPGSPYRMVLPDGDDAVVGTIEEAVPNERLVMTWRVLYDTAMAEEPPSRVEWLLTEGADGVTKVTTIHRDLARSPKTSAGVGDGWYWVLDSMKSLLETGEALAGSAPAAEGEAERRAAALADSEGELHRAMGITANNATWELLGADRELSPDEADDVLARAYAAAYHWRRAARRTPANAARGSWLVSRVHAVLGHGELALHHADRCLAHVNEAGLDDFDLAYAHEARARALACLGRLDEAAVDLKAARAVPIAEDEGRAIVDGDLASAPWYGLRLG